MNESAEVTLDQVEACLALFRTVQRAKDNAVARGSEMCVSADIWGDVLDTYADVAEQLDW